MKSTTVILLGLLVGFSSIKPVEATSVAATRAIVTQTDTAKHPNSSFTIAQFSRPNSGLYGLWQLTYSVDGLLYESRLYMNGYSGIMRTRYFDPRINQTQVVDQTMRLRSSSQGLVLLGYNPVYAGTNIPHPTYSADNFLFQIRPNGSLVVVTCDRDRRCSNVDMQKLR